MRLKHKIKILECIRQGQIGGGESHLLSLVQNLDRSRFDPVVLSFTDGPMIERLRDMEVKSHVIFTEKPFDISKWGTVKKLLKEEEIELVHAHGTRASSNIIWAARSLKIPVVYTVHGWSFHQDQHPFIKYIRIMGEKYLTTKSSVNISVSDSNKKSGKDLMNRFESVVINNGIDQRKFSPGVAVKNIREELGIPQQSILVLFIARFTTQKQPLTLIKAFKEALLTVPSMHLLMVGDGDLKNEALTFVDTNKLGENITFQSFRQDVPDVLAAADIFVLPSLWEGLPIGLLEAMAMGKAVIATEVDGTSEVLQQDENGILIETGSVSALSNALIRLSSDKNLREKLERNALKTVENKFNAVQMTKKIENIYIELLAGAGKN